MEKFKVGDRVKTNSNFFGNSKIVEKIGTITMINHDNSVCSVEFDDYIDGHDADGYGTYGHCWGVPMRFLEHANTDRKIVITTDGKTTTAKMYDGKKLVKSAKTDCHPDDEFIFIIGASIALERLTGQIETIPEEEQYFTGKAVCVNNLCFEGYFKVGKIYNIVAGELHSECEYFLKYSGVRSVDELNSRFPNNNLKFLEIVE